LIDAGETEFESGFGLTVRSRQGLHSGPERVR
jgi:hypothetical protein